jgi:alpha-tubulin suppressor-like RCC1 family protein
MHRTRAPWTVCAVVMAGACSSEGPTGGPPPPPPPPPAANLVRVSGDGQRAGVGTALPSAFVVKVMNSSGGNVPNVTVNWAVTIGGGTLDSNHTLTSANGQASVTLTFGATPGTTIVSATVAQLPPVVFTARAFGPPAKLSYAVQPGTAKGNEPLGSGVKIVVQDVLGDTVPNATTSVTVAITAGSGTAGATLGGTHTRTPVGGVLDFSDLKIDKAGTGYTLTASATGLSDIVSDPFNIEPGTRVKLGFGVQPTDVTAGYPMAAAVELWVEDQAGNVVPTAMDQVTLTITPGTGTPGAILQGGGTNAALNGVATFGVRVDKAGTGFTLTATSSALVSAVSVPFTVTAGPPFKVGFLTQPNDVTAGDTITPLIKVAIEDQLGNTVTTATNDVTVFYTAGISGATLRGTLTRPAVLGVATFDDLSLDKVGSYSLAASSASLNSDVSNSFHVNLGPPSQVAFITQPRDVMTDATFDTALTVVVQDAGGNKIATSSASITLEITNGTGAAGATLQGTVTRSADTGVAVFTDINIDTAAYGYTLTALSAGLRRDTTAQFRVVGPLSATQVSGGGAAFTTCAVVSGAGYCWGGSGNGQLGDGTVNPSIFPVAVSGGHTFATIASGMHECGVTTGGAAYCWGLGFYGELGNGANADAQVPSPVSGGLTFSSISAGTYHTCAVTTGGVDYCWGDNGGSDLGDSSNAPANTPQRVVGGHTWTQVSAGYEHSCAITPANQANCWGYGGHGALGNGVPTQSWEPVLVSDGHPFAMVAAGGDEHSCGVTTSGVAYCWGSNGLGQLGSGSDTIQTLTPVPVAGGLTFSSISGGGNHYCGVTTGGAAYCWGYNGYGQLCDGTMTNRNAPVPVLGGITFTSVSAGANHTCGIATSGVVFCWGFGNGILGNRSRAQSSVPVRVSQP